MLLSTWVYKQLFERLVAFASLFQDDCLAVASTGMTLVHNNQVNGL